MLSDFQANQVQQHTLQQSWYVLSNELALNNTDDMQQHIIQHYAAAGRAYHNVQHLLECLQHFAQVRHLAEHPAEVALALWFHDVVYDPQAADNERKSADMALHFLHAQEVDTAVLKRVDALIMATRTHEASTADQQLLVDIDLAILAAPAVRFAEYQQQIRQEYSFVAETLFQVKRAEVLAGFLQRPRIYQTAYFYQQLEKQARANLQHALKA
jgi:predicted metal-dependent HD superfamily phosphohydrolase